ncbi:hypothetical protein [Candidatus Thiosymbion oneisti]|uniref:hypothetical protein n=1 Tax=Candidatus Thiosymbion oneisti TaxID=589554 RepID=UPI00114CF60E|nr:hypothetical protein [Candidatus Thiosymbion oneisti]
MKQRLILLLPFLLLFLLLTSCGGQGAKPTPTPTPTDTDYCLKAEQNLKRMQCKDRAGDPMWVNRRGERFRDTCKTAQREGRIFLNPKCIANAKSCTEANRCPAEGMQ